MSFDSFLISGYYEEFLDTIHDSSTIWFYGKNKHKVKSDYKINSLAFNNKTKYNLDYLYYYFNDKIDQFTDDKDKKYILNKNYYCSFANYLMYGLKTFEIDLKNKKKNYLSL